MQTNLYKWHVYSALFISIFFTFLLLTGIANIFHGKIKQWENPHFFTEVDSIGELLSPEKLYRLYSEKQAELPLTLLRKLPGKDGKPIECMLLKDQKEVYGYVHPVTGELLGINENPLHKRILKWHTSLTLGKTGHLVMGIIAILIAVSLLTGFAYFLKKIQWRDIKSTVKKWHFSLGCITLIFNLMMIFSGIYLQYQDFTKQKKSIQQDYPIVDLHLDSVLTRAREDYPDVNFKRIKFPASSADPLILTGDQPGRWYLGSMPFELKLDSQTGQVLTVKNETAIKGNSWFQKTILTLHAGQYGDSISRWIYLIFSIGTLGSIFTGLWNYRNLRKNRRKQKY